MSENYYCACGYKWTSRKSFGGPARCPKCGGKNITPLGFSAPYFQYLRADLVIPEDSNTKSDNESPLISRTIHQGSHAKEIFRDSNLSAPQDETPAEKAERMSRIRKLIRAKVEAEK